MNGKGTTLTQPHISHSRIKGTCQKKLESDPTREMRKSILPFSFSSWGLNSVPLGPQAYVLTMSLADFLWLGYLGTLNIIHR